MTVGTIHPMPATVHCLRRLGRSALFTGHRKELHHSANKITRCSYDSNKNLSIPEKFSRGYPVITLECPPSMPSSRLATLIDGGSIDAVIRPDLPAIAELTTGSLSRLIASKLTSKGGDDKAPEDVKYPNFSAVPGRMRVYTVASHLDAKPTVMRKVEAALAHVRDVPSQGDVSGTGPAALMFVSGGGPLRKMIPPVLHTMDSSKAIQEAAAWRHAGKLPHDLMLWAVDNPNRPHDAVSAASAVASLRRKVDAGAQVLVTQPPFLWGPFQRWVDAVNKEGLPGRARFIVGVPFPTSEKSIRFWLRLCGINEFGADVADLIATFSRPLAHGPSDSNAHGTALAEAKAARNRQWVRQLVDSVKREMPFCAGFHLMPVAAWGEVEVLLKQPPWDGQVPK
eukprot:jgi/Mesvir1/8552/Mv18355-RA.1